MPNCFLFNHILHSDCTANLYLTSIYTLAVLYSFSFLITTIYINSPKSVKVKKEMRVKNIQSGNAIRTCILIISTETRTQLGHAN